jgi:transcription initiation factor TFIIB
MATKSNHSLSKKNVLSRTKRQKQPIDRSGLWEQFDEEICNSKAPIECVYRSSGEREKCDVCESPLALTEERFLACTNLKCGLIYKDSLDHTPEWRYHGAEDSHGADPTRCGMPINPLLQESSFGCRILCKNGSSYEMRKLRRYAEWQSMPHKEKTQYEEFQRISMMALHAGLPKMIVDDAMREHKRLSEVRTFRGLNRDGIIAASIYVSCKINGCPRTAKEIADIFMLDKASATKGCKTAVTLIEELECDRADNDKTTLSQTTPDTFIDRYCSKLNICDELTKLCRFIAMRIQQKQYIPENTPHSIAAGIVYFVANICGLEVTKHEVNKVTGISEVTINKCFKKLDGYKKELIPSPLVTKYNIIM